MSTIWWWSSRKNNFSQNSTRLLLVLPVSRLVELDSSSVYVWRRPQEIVSKCMQHNLYATYSAYWSELTLKTVTRKQRTERERDSLDQNPPEAAKAGAVRHFARVRYSHFLSDRARAPLLPESLPSSSSLVVVSTDDLVPRTVGVSGGDAAHSRTCGQAAGIISDRSDLFEDLFEDIPGDRHRESSWSLVTGLPSGSSCNTRMSETSWQIDCLLTELHWTSGETNGERGPAVCHLHLGTSTRDVNVTCGTHFTSNLQVFKLELDLDQMTKGRESNAQTYFCVLQNYFWNIFVDKIISKWHTYANFEFALNIKKLNVKVKNK